MGDISCMLALLHITTYSRKESSKIRALKPPTSANEGKRRSAKWSEESEEDEAAEEQQEVFLDKEDELSAAQKCNLVEVTKAGYTALHLGTYRSLSLSLSFLL